MPNASKPKRVLIVLILAVAKLLAEKNKVNTKGDETESSGGLKNESTQLATEESLFTPVESEIKTQNESSELATSSGVPKVETRDSRPKFRMDDIPKLYGTTKINLTSGFISSKQRLMTRA